MISKECVTPDMFYSTEDEKNETELVSFRVCIRVGIQDKKHR